MSIRNLPQIKAFDELSHLRFEPDETAVARWNPAIRAAQDDDSAISIYDVIGSDMFGEGVTAKRISGALRHIGSRDVTVNINSPGGDFFEGIAIYSLLREHPAKVTVKVMGLAASAASVIAMAGDEILMPEIGFLMLHNAWAIAIGNRHDMRQAADMLEPFDDAMAGLYAQRAGVEKADAAAWLDAETWFNGSSAVEAGLADGLLSDSDMSEMDSRQSQALLAERRAETAMRKGGLSRLESKSLVASLKAGRRDVEPHATRDAGDVAALRSLFDPLKH